MPCYSEQPSRKSVDTHFVTTQAIAYSNLQYMIVKHNTFYFSFTSADPLYEQPNPWCLPISLGLTVVTIFSLIATTTSFQNIEKVLIIFNHILNLHILLTAARCGDGAIGSVASGKFSRVP